MAGLTAIKRKGFRGGGMDASTSSFDKGATSKSANPSRPDTKEYGATDFQIANQGFTPTQVANQNAVTEQYRRNQEIKKDIEKRRLEKLNYVKPNPFKSVFDFGKTYLKNRQKGLYNLVPNNPKRELEFLSSLRISNPAKYNSLPQNLKDLLETTDQDFSPSYKNSPKFSFKDFNSLTKFDDGAFVQYAKDRGSPGLSVSGNMSQVGVKSVRKDQFGNPVKDMFGNTLFDYGEPTGGEGGNQNYLPLNYGVGVGTGTTDDVAEETTFDYRFGDGQNVGRDVTLGYAANGGRITRAGGGIMNAVPRQGYFLGKIVKGVGKAIGSVADAAGKVLKSDVGKMALLYGAGAMAGSYGLKGSLFSKGMFNPMNMKAGLFGANSLAMSKLGLGEMAAKKGLLANLGLTSGYGSFAPTIKGILAGSAILPFIPGINKAPENEDIGMADRGGRMPDFITGGTGTPAQLRASIESAVEEADGDPVKLAAIDQKYNNMLNLVDNRPYKNYALYADGGRIRAEEGGLMNLGGMEKDYRAEGGFVPIGKAEKADDVPARLSVNEFVFTADAVRNAGGGDIDKGAKVMENMMKNLENGGRVSEESQGKGNTGAKEMFSVSERIGEVI